MGKITRREIVGAALGGAAVLAGVTSNAIAADDSPSVDSQEQAERTRVIACGLTETEADCWIHASKAAAIFFQLPELHELDKHEVAHAIHVVQGKLLGRPAYRHYKELLPDQK